MTIDEELREIEEAIAKSWPTGCESQLLRIATEYQQLLADARDSALEAERDALRTTAERWGRAWQRAVEERNTLRAKLAMARGRVDEIRYALSIMFEHGPKRNDCDWQMWAHGYVESMIAGLDEALAAIDAPQLREGEVGSIK